MNSEALFSLLVAGGRKNGYGKSTTLCIIKIIDFRTVCRTESVCEREREKIGMERGMGESPWTLKEAHKIWENKILNTCCIMSSISRLFNGLLKLHYA